MQFCLKVVNIIRNLVIELLPTLSSGLDNILVQREQEKIVVPLYKRAQPFKHVKSFRLTTKL